MMHIDSIYRSSASHSTVRRYTGRKALLYRGHRSTVSRAISRDLPRVAIVFSRHTHDTHCVEYKIIFQVVYEACCEPQVAKNGRM